MIVEITYLIYLLISIGITVWIGGVLSQNGLIFLTDRFNGKEEWVKSINCMLLIGFYLINIGFSTLSLGYGEEPYDFKTAIEYISKKIGFALLLLGVMHFFLMFLIGRFRRNVQISDEVNRGE